MNAAQRINQTTGNVEWFTPTEIIEAARATMGGIDLDPASCQQAQRTVKADRWFGVDDDGLDQAWWGRVWLNHPFGRATNEPWITRLVTDYTFKRIEQACCITFACTSEQWFAPLQSFPQCFLRPRTNYLGPDGKPVTGVTKGSVVTYLGPNRAAFVRNFAGLGAVMVPAEVERAGWTQNGLFAEVTAA